jgi:hypothetical protein
MINHNNYEIWFLLYADNELSAEEKESVLLFVKENPSLEAEFNLLGESTLSVDETIVFSDKSILYRENIETSETAYVFEPNYSIVYPNKQALYKHTAARYTIWPRAFLAAACILFIAGMFWIFYGDNEQQKPIAAQPKILIKSENDDMVADKKFLTPNPVLVKSMPAQKQRADLKTRISEPTLNTNSISVNSEMIIASTTPVINKELRTNNLPTQLYNAETSKTDPLIVAEPIFISEPLSSSSNEMPVQYASSIQPAERNKIPLRGIIRKITRLIGKERPESDQLKFIEVANFRVAIAQ